MIIVFAKLGCIAGYLRFIGGILVAKTKNFFLKSGIKPRYRFPTPQPHISQAKEEIVTDTIIIVKVIFFMIVFLDATLSKLQVC